MKNHFLFFTLSLALTIVACEKKSEPVKVEVQVSPAAPDHQEKKQGVFGETGKKMDQGIQGTGEKIDQGLKKTGEEIHKGLDWAGDKLKDVTD